MIPLNQNPEHQEDTRIDHVLHSLASPPIPAHLQSRILHAVQQRSVQQRSATTPTRPAPRTWLLALAIPATAVLLLAVRLHLHPPPPTNLATTPTPGANLATAPSRENRGHLDRSEAQWRDPRISPSNPFTQGPALNPATINQGHLDRSEAEWRDPRIAPPRHHPLDPADTPTELASFPAPEAPLTEQEKLLLRVAQGPHHNFDPLTPDALEREIAENKAEFDHFFPPPPPPELTPLAPPTPQENPNEVHPLSR